MTAAERELAETPERLTLRTSLDVIDQHVGDPDLRDLVAMALDDHEPAAHAKPECTTCLTAMPCDVWSYAARESADWLFTQAQAIAARVQANAARHRAARELGRCATDLLAVRSDQPSAVPWVGDLP